MEERVKKYLSGRFLASFVLEHRRWKGIKLKLSFKKDETFFRHVGCSDFITVLDDLVIRKELGLFKGNRVYIDVARYRPSSNRPLEYSTSVVNIKNGTERFMCSLVRSSICSIDLGPFGEERPLYVKEIDKLRDYETEQFLMRVDFIKD